MDTKLTIEQIESMIACYPWSPFYIRNNIVIPNVSWGFLNHEAELERERKGAVRIVAIGVLACVVLIVSFVLLLLANGEKKPKKETKYVERIMVA